LDTIKALAPHAPVLLVATHIDERAPDLNYQLYKDAYPQLVGNLSVSNKDGSGILQVKAELAHQAMQLPLMGQPWPQTWIETETALMARPEQYIDADRYVQCCWACGVEEEIANGTLGRYLHDLGKILYFRDDFVLSNMVVLKPNWVTKAISRVLDDEEIRKAKGILFHSELPRIWSKDEDGVPYPAHLYPVFLRLMERFELSYQIEEENADPPNTASTKSLIPLLLPHQPPENLPASLRMPTPGQTQVEMVYQLGSVPAGIMSRFIVRTHRYTTNLHWREGAVLQYQGHQARVELNPMLRQIRLLVQGPLPQNFFTILMNTVDVVLARFEGLAVERKIPCICHWERGVSEPCGRFYRYEDLVHRMEVGRHTVERPETFVDVSVPQLLYGIHRSTNEKVMNDIQQGQQEIRQSLKELQKLDTILHKLDQQAELIVRSFTRQWNLEMQKMEAECPNTFILMPGSDALFNPKNWVSHEYRLYLLCQHPSSPHRVEEGYILRQAEDWWVTVSPWLNRLVEFLKFGVPMGKAIGAVYNAIDIKQMQDAIDLMNQIVQSIPELPALDTMKHVTTRSQMGYEQHAEGPALYSFLKEADASQVWGGLYKTPTPDGNILWLCDVHHKPYEVKPLRLETIV
jgi:hypothetical protein